MEIQRINPEQRWSDATVFRGIVHFVEVPASVDGDMAFQTRQILAQAEHTLALAGSDKTRLLMATIYVTDLTLVPAFNEIWDAWLAAGTAPARACIKVELNKPGMLVEIAFVAAAA